MLKVNIEQQLKVIINEFSVSKGLNEDILFTVEIPPKNINADLALNAAMIIAKKIKTNPRIIAKELIDIITIKLALVIKTAEIAGAGFINLYFTDTFLQKELERILEEKDHYAKQENFNKEKIMVEFVSANPTGPLHIGHGRGAAIGDSLARILKHLGYNVVKEYYLNDVGNQMNILGQSTETRYKQLKGENIPFLENGYQGDYIKDIAKDLINEGKNAEEINFKEESHKRILETIKKDLNLFAVSFDSWFSESKIAEEKDVNGKTEVDKVCDYLQSKNYAYQKDDALWLSSTNYGDDKDRVLKRSDGRYTYLASDVAYHKNKYERGFTKVINLWGADHHGYVARINAAIQMLGQKKGALKVILYQLVSLVRNGEPVAMSTRSGEFIPLQEVLAEVGSDACRFFFLLRAPDSQLEFDLELAKKQSSENPVFYVQYVNARCHSIFKDYKEDNNIPLDFNLLNSKEERDLIKKLISFEDVLLICDKTMSPHHLTTYLTETADIYHRFYEKCRVLGNEDKLTKARIELLKAVSIIITKGLDLLGVSSPEKM
ncbi:MAG: arginine--tRNA ligase [Endomicrobiia bacterium]|nr:arginine--tRNA ligase [Endomicrobiaceae bacterium]MDD3053049.1 arginine--tRNA ligase [Endomicrobiaceae bacterium]MDD3922186.1 arginine--tRNA ligase [Endomicrobiaceae bacterium]